MHAQPAVGIRLLVLEKRLKFFFGYQHGELFPSLGMRAAWSRTNPVPRNFFCIAPVGARRQLSAMLSFGFLRRLGLAAILPALAALAPAQEVRPDITGDRLTIDLATKRLVYAGNVRVVFGDVVLTADEIHYHEATKEVEATGRFVLKRGARRLIADAGTYNLATRALRVTNLRLGQFPVYLSGDSAAGTLDEFTVTNAQVFFRENASYTPSFSAKSLTYAQGRIVTADEVRLGLLGGRFLRLPRIEHALDAAFVSYLSGRIGYRASLGGILQAGLHLPVGPQFELGADAGFYTARGLMVGPSGRYGQTTDSAAVQGSFKSGYIRDHGDRKSDILGQPVPAGRSFVEWRHLQRVGEHLTVNGQFNYWSDSEILRDFRSNDFFPVQQPDSFLEANYADANYVLGALVRVHPNRFHRIQERLPELSFTLLPSPLLPGLYQRASASVAFLAEDAYLATVPQRATRLDAYYGLTWPIAPTPWFTFAPVVGGRFTSYSGLSGGAARFTRSLAETGFDARLQASGTFDYRNEIWEIDGLRHLVEPVLSYRYAPAADRGRRFIPSIDRRTFATTLPPLSIADSRNIDDLQRLDTLRLAFNNTLQTRDQTHGSRDLASLDVAADYWFTRANNRLGRKGVSDLHTALALQPARWLQLSAYHRFDPHRTSGQEFNTAIEVTDQEWWSVKLGTHYLKHDYQEYSLDYRQRLNEVWDVVGRWRFDAERSRFNEQTYGVWQRLGQTWTVKYEMSFFEGPRRESSFGLNVEVELLKF